MILTINFINASNTATPSLMAVCNLTIDTDEPAAVKESYAKYIPIVQKEFKGNAASLLQEVTQRVMKDHPSMVLLSVNDDRNLSDQTNSLNVNLQKK